MRCCKGKKFCYHVLYIILYKERFISEDLFTNAILSITHEGTHGETENDKTGRVGFKE